MRSLYSRLKNSLPKAVQINVPCLVLESDFLALYTADHDVRCILGNDLVVMKHFKFCIGQLLFIEGEERRSYLRKRPYPCG